MCRKNSVDVEMGEKGGESNGESWTDNQVNIDTTELQKII
jgi:hypothetical protein